MLPILQWTSTWRILEVALCLLAKIPPGNLLLTLMHHLWTMWKNYKPKLTNLLGPNKWTSKVLIHLFPMPQSERKKPFLLTRHQLATHTPRAADSSNTNVPHSEDSNNMFPPQGMEPLVIPYSINQPVDPQLWDSNSCPVSLFRTNKYEQISIWKETWKILSVCCSGIKQCKLEGKSEKDISQIAEFGFAMWEFISSIYKAG